MVIDSRLLMKKRKPYMLVDREEFDICYRCRGPIDPVTLDTLLPPVTALVKGDPEILSIFHQDCELVANYEEMNA